MLFRNCSKAEWRKEPRHWSRGRGHKQSPRRIGTTSWTIATAQVVSSFSYTLPVLYPNADWWRGGLFVAIVPDVLMLGGRSLPQSPLGRFLDPRRTSCSRPLRLWDGPQARQGFLRVLVCVGVVGATWYSMDRCDLLTPRFGQFKPTLMLIKTRPIRMSPYLWFLSFYTFVFDT